MVWRFFKSTQDGFILASKPSLWTSSTITARSHLTVDNHAIAKITYAESHSSSRQTENIHKSIINTLSLFLQPWSYSLIKLSPYSFSAGFLSPSTAFSTVPAIPLLLASNWLPAISSFEKGPPIFLPICPIEPSGLNCLPMAPPGEDVGIL